MTAPAFAVPTESMQHWLAKLTVDQLMSGELTVTRRVAVHADQRAAIHVLQAMAMAIVRHRTIM